MNLFICVPPLLSFLEISHAMCGGMLLSIRRLLVYWYTAASRPFLPAILRQCKKPGLPWDKKEPFYKPNREHPQGNIRGWSRCVKVDFL
jgi:hypothetical protein